MLFRSALPATEFYRQTLAGAADDSVVIVSIGQFTALAGLLDSDADLVRQKVHALVSMACAFPEGREFNVFMDAPAAKRVFTEFPHPIICSGFEVGVDVLTGFAQRPQNAGRNPVFDAYRLYLEDETPLRPSWDLTAVQFAVEGPGKLYALSEAIRIHIAEDGANRCEPWDGHGAPRFCLHRRVESTELAAHLSAALHASDQL